MITVCRDLPSPRPSPASGRGRTGSCALRLAPMHGRGDVRVTGLDFTAGRRARRPSSDKSERLQLHLHRLGDKAEAVALQPDVPNPGPSEMVGKYRDPLL